MSKLIEPRVLKGFRDYPPSLMIPRERLMEAARCVYRSYGFAPIDTPAIELTEVLLAKVEQGLAQLDAGQGVEHGKAKRRLLR